MTRIELEKMIHKEIPLSKKMGLRVQKCSVLEGISFQLPLKPNKNHKNTAFGGTLVAAQALCCWAWLVLFLRKNNIDAEVVLHKQEAFFHKPVAGDFVVHTLAPNDLDKEHFFKTISSHNKARLTIYAEVIYEGREGREGKDGRGFHSGSEIGLKVTDKLGSNGKTDGENGGAIGGNVAERPGGTGLHSGGEIDVKVAGNPGGTGKSDVEIDSKLIGKLDGKLGVSKGKLVAAQYRGDYVAIRVQE